MVRDGFLYGLATGLEVSDRRAAEVERIGRLGHRGDEFADPFVAIHDDLVVRVSTGVLLELLEIGDVAKVHPISI